MRLKEPEIPIPQSPKESEFLESHLTRLRNLVTEAIYFQGLRDGERGGMSIPPRFSNLSIRWVRAYSCINLFIDIKGGGTGHEMRVFSQRDQYDYSRQFNMAVAIYTDELLELFLPGIRVHTSIRQCSMPFHFRSRWDFFPTRKDSFIDYEPHITECKNKDGRWYCYDCEERYNLPAPIVRQSENNQERNERAKMTSRLRFEVLEKYEFACGICGRSPLKGDDVKLHVDHKMPIAKGGKTEIDNLWALCQECNLGKRDKVVTQLVMTL